MAVRHPTVVLTGARGAIGSASASALRQRGATVIALTRRECDLSSLISVRNAAAEIIRSTSHLDALLNIAAVFTTGYKKSTDGFELMFATNHLGPFLLTNLLRDRLSGGGRVITVAAPSTSRVEVDRLLDRAQFNPTHSFGASKAANLMFTFELARRAHRWDVRANAFHPGLVRSELMHEAPAFIRAPLRLISRSPRRAAEDMVDLALSPAHAGTTGWLFKGVRHIEAPGSALDTAQQSQLWQRSAELVELEGGF